MPKKKMSEGMKSLRRDTTDPRMYMAMNRDLNTRRKANKNRDMGIYSLKGNRRVPPKKA